MTTPLEGKVAVVTGAAHGLGRVEALELANLGARVVVNDLGVDAAGSGRSKEAAQAVVDEIKSAGGEAVAAFGDVADWADSENMIKTAVDTFGGLDILVNNAGFLRDKMIFGMSEQDFDDVVRVHLKGHFCGMRHATAYWRDKGKTTGEPVNGRIISTASEAAIFCSVGQPNYAAAKSGIVAMTIGTAQAMAKYGVTANVIMPRARTRMTDQGTTAQMFAKPEDGFDNFGPENVAPLVGYLASPQAQRINGYVMVVWGRQVTIIEGPSFGHCIENEDLWNFSDLQEKLTPHFEKLEPIKDGFAITGG
jgi:3-oxoacyl-[acyl-carrier protein] reductase